MEPAQRLLKQLLGMGAFSLDGLVYFDKYDNRLDEYYNYNAFELGIHAPHSDYLELAPDFTLRDWLTIGLAFSLNNYHIDHTQDGITVLSYYPHITFNGYAVVKPFAFLSIIPRLEYMDFRYGDTEGTDLLEVYVLAHIKITIAWGNYVSVSAELDNILDTYYEIRRYSPQGGRSLNLMLTVNYK